MPCAPAQHQHMVPENAVFPFYLNLLRPGNLVRMDEQKVRAQGVMAMWTKAVLPQVGSMEFRSL